MFVPGFVESAFQLVARAAAAPLVVEVHTTTASLVIRFGLLVVLGLALVLAVVRHRRLYR